MGYIGTQGHGVEDHGDIGTRRDTEKEQSHRSNRTQREKLPRNYWKEKRDRSRHRRTDSGSKTRQKKGGTDKKQGEIVKQIGRDSQKEGTVKIQVR